MADRPERPRQTVIDADSLEDCDYYHDPDEVNAYMDHQDARIKELEALRVIKDGDELPPSISLFLPG